MKIWGSIRWLWRCRSLKLSWWSDHLKNILCSYWWQYMFSPQSPIRGIVLNGRSIPMWQRCDHLVLRNPEWTIDLRGYRKFCKEEKSKSQNYITLLLQKPVRSLESIWEAEKSTPCAGRYGSFLVSYVTFVFKLLLKKRPLNFRTLFKELNSQGGRNSN